MKEMSAHQQGMSFYGQMPDQYNLVINTSHPLIQDLFAKLTESQEQPTAEGDPTTEGGPTGEADPTAKAVTKFTLSDNDERLKQLIDIALLASGKLSGEPLAKFVNRSVELLS